MSTSGKALTAGGSALALLIDARCLQDHVLRQRGIGRLLRTLLAQRPADCLLEPVALIHDEFPRFAGADELFFSDIIRYEDVLARSRQPFLFLNPAPMSFNPTPNSPLVAGRATKRHAICFDFIPLTMPELFLADPASRVRYLAQLVHLATYDFYFSISVPTDRRVRSLFGASDLNTSVIGCPVVPHIAAQAARRRPTEQRTRFLVIGDPSAHKDIETAIRGHARFVAATGLAIALAITGRIPQHQIERLTNEHAATAGRPGLLEFKGVVEDGVLDELYNSAVAVLVPSRAEGFSMPVIEGMCSGAVVIASRIEAHQNLIQQQDLLFEPGDHEALSRILVDIMRQPERRQRVIGQNDAVWQFFTADQVAQRFWTKLQGEALG